MGQKWPEDIGAYEPRKRRSRYGDNSEMQAVYDAIEASEDQDQAITDIRVLYPHADPRAVSRIAFNGRRWITKDQVQVERLIYKFIAAAHRSVPEREPQSRPSLWSRVWPWLAFVYAPTGLLLTATELAR